MQEAGADVLGPLSTSMLLEHRPEVVTSFVHAEIHNGEAKFHASQNDATRAKAGFAECFPCGTTARNVCRGELAALGLGSRFEQMKLAWNRYIDSLSKASLRDAQVVFTLRCQSAEGRSVHAWYMIAKVVGSPKVQVLLRCCPSIVAGMQNSFFYGEVELPYTLTIQSRRSRLCPDHDTPTLHHETSEEVIFAMLQCSTTEWSIVPLVWEFPDDASSLLDMKVTACLAAVPLVCIRTKASCAVDSLVEMRTGSVRALAPAQGPGTSSVTRDRANSAGPSIVAGSRRPAELPTPLLDGGGHAVMSDEEEIDAIDALCGEARVSLDAGTSEEPLFDLVGGLQDLMNEHIFGMEPGEDEEEEHGQTEELDECPGASSTSPSIVAGVEGGSSSSTDLGVAAGHVEVAVEAVAVASEEVPEFPKGTEFSLGGTLALGPYGYVVCSLPPFEGRQIGTVGQYLLRAKMFANCHLHPNCAIQVGVAVQPVSRMKLAQWLATGHPSQDMPAADRRRLGAQHRAQWSRHGPLGEMGPLGNLEAL